MAQNIGIFCNPLENSKLSDLAKQVTYFLRKAGVDHDVFSKEWPPVLDDFAQAWIIGGDGTLNYFINKYKSNFPPLSIFPGGTGNDFYWLLYGKVSVGDQVNGLLTGVKKMIDGGTCNGRLFLNGVGIGFDGAIAKDLFGRKKLSGRLSYLISVLKHIVGYTEKSCVIKTESNCIGQKCFMISIANGQRYGGGFLVAPKASLEDGKLDVSIMGTIPPLKRIRYLPLTERGEHLHLPFMHYWQAGLVQVKAEAKLHAHIDGEYFYSDHFEINCLPKRFPFVLISRPLSNE